MAASKFDVDEFLREELTVDNLRKLKIVAQTLNVDVTACTRKAEILDARMILILLKMNQTQCQK